MCKPISNLVNCTRGQAYLRNVRLTSTQEDRNPGMGTAVGVVSIGGKEKELAEAAALGPES